jgi:peptidoglycan/xylan/chitin deacetylase (PgdA/CDA1 family)
VTHGPRDSRSVALTFDDGFNVPACISIVDTLIARDAAATFFPNGQYVRERPGFWHWVAANGFPVGSHATTHHDATTLSTSQLVLDLGSERRILDESLGVPSIDAFRPPFGSYDSRVLDVAGAAGYPLMVGWDVDSKDQDGARDVNEVIANATTGTGGSIVLMHCGSPLTPLALPAIIDRYRAQGLSFVTIPQMFRLASPAAGWAPPTSPDPWPVTEVAAGDPQPSWNASPAIDGLGHLHLAYETPTGITYGDDASGSWQSETVAATSGSAFESRPSIAVDPSGGTHLVYLSSTTAGTQLLYRHRTGDGAWTDPTVVATLGAPASTATVAIDRSGAPVIAYVVLGGPSQGIALARPAPNGWSRTLVPTTDGTFLAPSIAIDARGAIHLVERRNGFSEIDERVGRVVDGPNLRDRGKRRAVRGLRSLGPARRGRAGVVRPGRDARDAIGRWAAHVDDGRRCRGSVGACDRTRRPADRGVQPDRRVRRTQPALARQSPALRNDANRRKPLASRSQGA